MSRDLQSRNRSKRKAQDSIAKKMKRQGLKMTYLIIPNIADLASYTSNHAMFSGNSIQVNLK